MTVEERSERIAEAVNHRLTNPPRPHAVRDSFADVVDELEAMLDEASWWRWITKKGLRLAIRLLRGVLERMED